MYLVGSSFDVSYNVFCDLLDFSYREIGSVRDGWYYRALFFCCPAAMLAHENDNEF